jgi:pimeloyl-ACP methyl ester carboxylesterase
MLTFFIKFLFTGKVWRGTATASTSEKNIDKEPPILCVHGWLDNSNSFDALLPKIIQPGRTFYAYDLPGHGFSSHVHTTHYNSHVESHLTIARVAKFLNVDKFTLIGHSMGAEACCMYAAIFPE